MINKLEWLKLIILLIGSLIIIYIGQGLIRSKSSFKESSDTNISLVKVITTACVVTWFNPQAIIDGSMMLGAFRVDLAASDATYFILGVVSASFTWFTGVTLFVSFFRDKLNDKVLRVINIVCGAIIIFYGIKLLLSFYTMLKG